jgi:hypothetical protein
MRHLIRRPARIALAAVFMGLTVSAALAFDLDDDDLVDEAARLRDLNPHPVNVQDVAASIDAWVFEINGAPGQRPETRLELLLRKRVQEVTHAATISVVQEQKLSLAGRGDIRRFIERVDAIKARYPSDDPRPHAWNDIAQEVEPLQSEVRHGLFGNHSLFAKTLTKMLNPEDAEPKLRHAPQFGPTDLGRGFALDDVPPPREPPAPPVKQAVRGGK